MSNDSETCDSVARVITP